MLSVWSPCIGKGNVTTNSAIIGLFLSTFSLGGEKTLVSSLNTDSSLHNMFSNSIARDSMEKVKNLTSFLNSGRLTPKILEAMTANVKGTNLDLLQWDSSFVEENIVNGLHIFKECLDGYENIVFDLGSGNLSKIGSYLLDSSKAIILCVSQERSSLPSVIRAIKYLEDKNKPFILLIGSFEKDSNFNISELSSLTGINRKSIKFIPYYIDIHNKIYDGSLSVLLPDIITSTSGLFKKPIPFILKSNLKDIKTFLDGVKH